MLLEPEDNQENVNYQELIDRITVGENESFHPLTFEYITNKQMIMKMSKEQLQWYACNITALYFNTKIVMKKTMLM